MQGLRQLTWSLLVSLQKRSDIALIAGNATSKFKNFGELVKFLLQYVEKQSITAIDDHHQKALYDEEGIACLVTLVPLPQRGIEVPQPIVDCVIPSKDRSSHGIFVLFDPDLVNILTYLRLFYPESL